MGTDRLDGFLLLAGRADQSIYSMQLTEKMPAARTSRFLIECLESFGGTALEFRQAEKSRLVECGSGKGIHEPALNSRFAERGAGANE